jgi:(1->4)-alpha-D-glucan 1-alpha-D-glucosylmutase
MVLQKHPAHFTQDDRDAQLRFAGKFQQLTAPVTAKGIEDTTFYQYNRLVSLNEVGGEPGKWGTSPEEAHAWFAERARRWPYAMSTLSTHDTKRSEDVRARINVLSEMAPEFTREASLWREVNAPLRNQGPSITANEEWLLYQTLVGAYPSQTADAAARETFIERIQAYMLKAMREAKVSTSWIEPNDAHEQAVAKFVSDILLKGSPFLAHFEPVQRQVAQRGLINSLAQTLLKFAAPGVPDTYQGTELLDFSLVDPDNRRPVDYDHRRKVLDDLKREVESAGNRLADFAQRVTTSAADGRAKLYITWRLLTLRRERPGLFTEGEYLPIETGGRHLFAFTRRLGDQTAIVAVPLTSRGAGGSEGLRLPAAIPSGRYRNVFTAEGWNVGRDSALPTQALFKHFPVALLIS